MQRIQELSRPDCVRLLRAGVGGRLAFVVDGEPHVIPVNYVVHEESVLVRTTPYSLLGTHARGTVVCFEVDQLDHENQRGWSVAVRGRVEVVDEPDDLAEIADTAPLRSWAEGSRSLVLRIPWAEIGGRQLGEGWDPVQHLPVRRLG